MRQKAHDHYERHRDEIAPKRRAYDRERWANDTEYRKRKNEWKKDKYRTDPAFKARKLHLSSTRHRRLYRDDPIYRQRKKEASAAAAPLRNRYGRDARGKFTAREWRELCERYDFCCLRCGHRKPLSPDHIRPLSRGGANTIDNIQPLCEPCNEWKFVKTIDYRPLWDGDETPSQSDIQAYETVAVGDQKLGP